MTIFLALEKLSSKNGLPKFSNNAAGQKLQSSNIVLVGNDILQILEENSSSGFALVSD
jgi:hypothetical protein